MGEFWRVIFTDSESESGVAPVCPRQREDGWEHDRRAQGEGESGFDEYGIYDCCPHPHLEAGSTEQAKALVKMLNEFAVEVCS